MKDIWEAIWKINQKMSYPSKVGKFNLDLMLQVQISQYLVKSNIKRSQININETSNRHDIEILTSDSILIFPNHTIMIIIINKNKLLIKIY